MATNAITVFVSVKYVKNCLFSKFLTYKRSPVIHGYNDSFRLHLSTHKTNMVNKQTAIFYLICLQDDDVIAIFQYTHLHSARFFEDHCR